MRTNGITKAFAADILYKVREIKADQNRIKITTTENVEASKFWRKKQNRWRREIHRFRTWLKDREITFADIERLKAK